MSNIALRKKAAREARMRAAGVVVKKVFGGLVYKPKKLELELGGEVARGQNVSIFLPRTLNSLYGRENLCLKLFKLPGSVWGHPRGVGISPIFESTIIQNLMALQGLAPRVFDLVEVKGKTAQVTEYIKGKMGVVSISDPRFRFDPKEIGFEENFIDGKFVDFQGTIFKDFKAYRDDLIARAMKGTQYHGAGGGAYQSSRYFKGLRDTEKRLLKYKFFGFSGKKVLDIGCSYGAFCQVAVKLGAKRVVGLDWSGVIKIAQELAILDGFFNIDFYGVDIKKLAYSVLQELTGIRYFEIHLFLAMENWVGFPDWVKICDTLYYEGHGAERPFRVEHFKRGDWGK